MGTRRTKLSLFALLLTSPLAASDSALVIREDIENRVARAGGERGSLSISLSWRAALAPNHPYVYAQLRWPNLRARPPPHQANNRRAAAAAVGIHVPAKASSHSVSSSARAGDWRPNPCTDLERKEWLAILKGGPRRSK